MQHWTTGMAWLQFHRHGESWEELPAPAYPTKPEGIEDKDPVRGIDITTQLIWA